VNDCPITAVDHRGKAVYQVSGNAPTGADSTHFTIKRWTPAGVQWTKIVAFTPKQFSEAYLDSVSEPDLTVALQGKIDPKDRGIARAVRLPFVNFPTVSGATAGMDGMLFLRREEDSTIVRWTIVRPDGEIAGSIDLPFASRIVEGDAGHIWVVELDAEGQSQLARYRLGVTR
jgi:hypothetical protein